LHLRFDLVAGKDVDEAEKEKSLREVEGYDAAHQNLLYWLALQLLLLSLQSFHTLLQLLNVLFVSR